MESSPLLGSSDRPNHGRVRLALTVLLGVAICLLLGIVAIALIRVDGIDRIEWIHMFMEVPNKDRARQHMHRLTLNQSLSGSGGDLPLAEYIKDQLNEYGVPLIEMKQYNVLLSTPISSSLDVIDPFTGNSLRSFDLQEGIINGEGRPPIGPYIAYSGSGTVQSTLIYLNYGRQEDFNELMKRNIPLAGHIGIARYGKIFRGIKAMLAERYGMIGLILYSDPIDDGVVRGPTYPDGPWRPASSIQGGSAMFNSLYSGDPLTPGVAATPDLSDTDRKYQSDTSPVLPHIPIIAIGYGNADPLLRSMMGPSVPLSWQGGLSVQYRFGPGRDTIRLSVMMERNIRPIYNVIGTFPGSIESDRRVLIGNHRDAWVYGAVDPHSGTTAFIEVARSLGVIYSKGWRPRRTVQLCSWDAEEFGLIGSTEYVEEYESVLTEEAISYINVDVGVSGLKLFATQSSPTLSRLIQYVTRIVPNPNSSHSVYEDWKRSSRGVVIDPLGSGSDYSGFLQYLGISSADIRFGDRNGSYGVYHSAFDSLNWYETYNDGHYSYTTTLAKLWGVLLLELADRAVVPLRLTDYAKTLISSWASISRQYPSAISIPDQLMVHRILNQFHIATRAIDSEADTLDRLTSGPEIPPNSNDQQLRHINNRLSYLERHFICNQSLPDRVEHFYRHIVYAPGLYEGYDAVIFPGIHYAVQIQNQTMIKVQIEILVNAIQKAMESLRHDVIQ